MKYVQGLLKQIVDLEGELNALKIENQRLKGAKRTDAPTAARDLPDMQEACAPVGCRP
jgi:hypothetical protein